jgi:aminoglycoside phosphotransferase (APT) family kinase protein
LRSTGVLPHGRVSDINIVPLGLDRGLTGRVARVRLSYEGAPDGAPPSLVAKFAAEAGPTRSLADRFNLYRRESHFYAAFAARSPAPTPRAYYASDEHQPFVLLLEDLEGGREIDLRTGCTLDEAAAVTDVLAETHAAFWNDPALVEQTWLPPPNHSVILDLIEESSDASWRKFKAQFGQHMPARLVTLGNRVAPDRSVLDRLSAPPWTLVHADLRAHNIIFDGTGSSKPLAVIDWQTATRARAPVDVASFFVSSLSVADRRIAEAELLPAYHGALVARGVRDYTWAQCWDDYGLGAINQFSQVIALFALTDVHDRIEGDVSATTGERLIAALLDLDLLDMVQPAGIADAVTSAARRRLPRPVKRLLRSVMR